MGVDQPIVLLGAGASADAGIPVSAELTKQMLDLIAGSNWRTHSQALEYVVAELVAYDTRLKEGRATDLPDIERVASAVELLANRDQLEVSPFVGSWARAVESFETPGEPRQPSFFKGDMQKALTARDRAVGSVRVPFADGGKVADLVWKAAIQARSDGSVSRVYAELLDRMISSLSGLLAAPNEESFDYLRPLLQQRGLTIASLNYDLGVELAASRAGVRLSCGIDLWQSTGVVAFEEDCTRLMKLHGSLDWRRNQAHGGLTEFELEAATPDSRSIPFLVFGQREKLRASGPFLQLLESFRSALMTCQTLIVVGYRFRDPHINEVVGRWLQANPAARLLIVDPYFDPTKQSWPYMADYRHVLARSTIGGQSARLVFRQESAREFFARVEEGDLSSVVELLFAAQAEPEKA